MGISHSVISIAPEDKKFVRLNFYSKVRWRVPIDPTKHCFDSKFEINTTVHKPAEWRQGASRRSSSKSQTLVIFLKREWFRLRVKKGIFIARIVLSVLEAACAFLFLRETRRGGATGDSCGMKGDQPMKKPQCIAALAVIILAGLMPALGDAQANFYEGKTITLLATRAELWS